MVCQTHLAGRWRWRCACCITTHSAAELDTLATTAGLKRPEIRRLQRGVTTFRGRWQERTGEAPWEEWWSDAAAEQQRQQPSCYSHSESLHSDPPNSPSLSPSARHSPRAPIHAHAASGNDDGLTWPSTLMMAPAGRWGERGSRSLVMHQPSLQCAVGEALRMHLRGGEEHTLMMAGHAWVMADPSCRCAHTG
jgi:hypothetical protein